MAGGVEGLDPGESLRAPSIGVCGVTMGSPEQCRRVAWWLVGDGSTAQGLGVAPLLPGRASAMESSAQAQGTQGAECGKGYRPGKVFGWSCGDTN